MPALVVLYFSDLHLLLPSASIVPGSARLTSPLADDDALLKLITDKNRDFVYIPSADILLATLAKGGSTSLFQCIFAGVTGVPRYSVKQCGSYVHNVHSPCWNNQATYLYNLSLPHRRKVLTGATTLRVAIQRNPYDRLLSAFKSKFTCNTTLYGTDVRNRESMVPTLRRQAALPLTQPNCMNISEFAEALDRCRQIVTSNRTLPFASKLKHLRKLDIHIRPQQFFFEYISYHIVLDVDDLSNVTNLTPLLRRLPFVDLVSDGVRQEHASKSYNLLVPELAAGQLHRFALESKVGAIKYPTSV
ncbi:hypothetical protein BWQ96_00898 [Gracilariopsis chorda]|uniref:Uncharacterized protein n=1 Tax=Gracilariopsis chorda TaxID=448386 RepID=A0A2V3J4L9_9FLOR|nr:hypothetical protein BWQ96_00898 [Gracilariopsis chorda]|eukprot:PXF49324.1 hypothetical protein BWQ96_00898 [Gracilariopsis chorda]